MMSLGGIVPCPGHGTIRLRGRSRRSPDVPPFRIVAEGILGGI